MVMAGGATRQLKLGKARQYDALRRRYRTEDTFRALVDMYRNISLEDEVASHWMAAHDLEKYAVDGRFMPLAAGYDQRELDFLRGRNIPVL